MAATESWKVSEERRNTTDTRYSVEPKNATLTRRNYTQVLNGSENGHRPIWKAANIDYKQGNEHATD